MIRPTLTIALLVTVALAGCSGDDPATTPGEVVDKDSFELQAGKGAIAGILVDDRFRPIELTDSPQTEFQTTGFVLLQETGEQTQTTENGEFSFVDLEPGTYTVRVTADGHEAVPTRIRVTEGIFNEASVVARRVLSDLSFIVSTEFSAFSSCGVNAIIIGTPLECTGDASGDSDRAAFTTNYTDFDATYFVMEMRGNNPNYYDVWLRPLNNDQTCTTAYQIMGGPDTQYLRWQLQLGEIAVSSEGASGAGCEGVPWLNDQDMQTVLYLNSLGFEEGVGFGLGVYVGVQANFVQNVFIGEPQVDVDSFCVFC